MTETQRNYLADLAARKGIRLKDTDNLSVAAASAKIEELKALPDAEYMDITDGERQELNKLTANTDEELEKWTFQQ